MPRQFRDRAEAGRLLARHLAAYAAEQPVVLGLARGGVVVAAAVARALGAPLDGMVARSWERPGIPSWASAPSRPECGSSTTP
jgi:putative phosphoribosyl transferase